MTVLQSCGLMEFHVLQWCHPMPARAEGGQAVVPGSLPCMVRESGFRPAHKVWIFLDDKEIIGLTTSDRTTLSFNSKLKMQTESTI